MLVNQWKQWDSSLIYELFNDEFYPFNEEIYRGSDMEIQEAISYHPYINFIGTAGIPLHTDKGFPQYSYHLVLRNNGLLTKGKGRYDLDIQCPGTIIVLDVHHPHHVIYDKRIKKPKYPLWISACYDDKYLLSKEQIIDTFKGFLFEYGY